MMEILNIFFVGMVSFHVLRHFNWDDPRPALVNSLCGEEEDILLLEATGWCSQSGGRSLLSIVTVSRSRDFYLQPALP